MTQPTIIFFGPDLSKTNKLPLPKIYLRTLLFSTAKRGLVIESMHVSLRHNESHQNFPVWVYGEERLVRGSGLFVGEDGIATNHHFMTLKDGTNFQFASGHYELTVFAKLLGAKTHRKLFSQNLEVSPEHFAEMRELHTGVYFDWGPDASRYLAHCEKHEPGVGPDDVFHLLKSISSSKEQTHEGNLPSRAP